MPITQQTFDIGDTVLCDLCGEDYTLSDAKGGILFSSKGICPTCAPRIETDAIAFGETRFIIARAEPDETFASFIRRIRNGNNTITITTFEKD
jgi:hypothetical protein